MDRSSLAADPELPFQSNFSPVYAASKAALNAVTLAMMIETEASDIKVNLVSPGFAKTALVNFEGTDSIEDAAREILRVARLGPTGPTGPTGPGWRSSSGAAASPSNPRTSVSSAHRLTGTPAEIITELAETLRQSPLGIALTGDRTRYSGPARSIGYRWFTDPDIRRRYAPEEHAHLSWMFASSLRQVVALRGPGSRAARATRNCACCPASEVRRPARTL